MSNTPAYQTATVGDGVQLAYLDSWAGKPKADVPASYTTLLALHGFGFNSGEPQTCDASHLHFQPNLVYQRTR
jgi:hypothetical protein